MAKICTDIEQSKKLVELGLDTNTADMWHQHIGGTFRNGEEKPLYLLMVNRDNPTDNDIPAWSMSALLNLLPFPNLYLSNLGGTYVWKCDITFIEGETIQGELTDEAIDTVFGMVCWVLENKKL